MSELNINLPSKTDNAVHKMSDHVSFRWVDNGAAYEVSTQSSKEEEVEVYIEVNILAIRQWDKLQKFYSIQNMSHPDVAFTSYLKVRLNEVAEIMKEKEITGVSMIVMSSSIIGQLLKVLSRFFVNKVNNKVYQKWFTDIEKARADLKKHLSTSRSVI